MFPTLYREFSSILYTAKPIPSSVFLWVTPFCARVSLGVFPIFVNLAISDKLLSPFARLFYAFVWEGPFRVSSVCVLLDAAPTLLFPALQSGKGFIGFVPCDSRLAVFTRTRIWKKQLSH